MDVYDERFLGFNTYGWVFFILFWILIYFLAKVAEKMERSTINKKRKERLSNYHKRLRDDLKKYTEGDPDSKFIKVGQIDLHSWDSLSYHSPRGFVDPDSPYFSFRFWRRYDWLFDYEFNLMHKAECEDEKATFDIHLDPLILFTNHNSRIEIIYNTKAYYENHRVPSDKWLVREVIHDLRQMGEDVSKTGHRMWRIE